MEQTVNPEEPDFETFLSFLADKPTEARNMILDYIQQKPDSTDTFKKLAGTEAKRRSDMSSGPGLEAESKADGALQLEPTNVGAMQLKNEAHDLQQGSPR